MPLPNRDFVVGGGSGVLYQIGSNTLNCFYDSLKISTLSQNLHQPKEDFLIQFFSIFFHSDSLSNILQLQHSINSNILEPLTLVIKAHILSLSKLKRWESFSKYAVGILCTENFLFFGFKNLPTSMKFGISNSC